MQVLVEFHRLALPIPIIGHHLVLLTVLLFAWSLIFLVRTAVPAGFVVLLRVTWAAYALNALSGVVLALSGMKVPSAVPAPGRDTTVFGLPPDPSRHPEHFMYAFFFLVSLYAMEVMIAGRVIKHERALRLMPVVTLFLAGVAYMSVRVAYLPGSTPGT